MNTIRLKKIVEENLKRIDLDIEKESTIFVSDSLGKHIPGDYYFVDETGKFRSVSIGDRGRIEEEKDYNTINDILFALYRSVTFRLSVDYAKKHKKAGEDWRKTMFSKQLELLRILGEEYCFRGQCEINEILRNNPYDDKLC